VRRANRDDHVMRTFEIPACGAFMLTERTDTHLELFEEDREAAYFSSADELVSKVLYYLRHDSERMRISEAGYKKLSNGRHTYGDRLAQIIETAQALP
jgi:spore maturation protein CgeB